MSSHCGLTKMDQIARAELRTWLDEELGKRKASARADTGLGADAIHPIIGANDGPSTTSVRGGRTKRNRATYIDSGSDGDDDENIARSTRTRARATAVPGSSTMESSQAAKGSAFVQQAIELVTSSQTVKEQLADIQKKLDSEVEARLKAEQENKTTSEALNASMVEFKDLESKTIELQQKFDKINRAGGIEKEALDKAIRRQSLSEDTANRIRREREELRDELAEVYEQLEVERGIVVGLQADVDEEKRDLIKEKADHAKTTSQLVKWKATFAALQGL
jgi:chromosome segregation ATPase